VFAKANQEKSGDACRAGGGDRSRARGSEQGAGHVRLGEIVAQPLVIRASMIVSSLLIDSARPAALCPASRMTLAIREYCSITRGEAELQASHAGIAPDVAAAVVKLMSNKDGAGGQQIRNVSRCRNTAG